MTQNNDRMRRIGLTGGVGCGKSAVMQYLEEGYAAAVLRSDEIARDLMEPGGACYPEIRALLGDGFLQADGHFDRAAIAAAVFEDPPLLEKMNAILHPATWQEIHRREEEEETGGRRLFCVESALMLTQKDNEMFDELWYVYADEQTRRTRLKESRGYSDEKITEIMRNQNSDAEFRMRCDVVLDNSGPIEETKRQIDRILGE